MGLISQAKRISPDSMFQSAPETPSINPKGGLLRRTSNVSAYDAVRVSFDAFLLSSGSERGGILFPTEAETLSLVFSEGFDFTTSRRFIPSISSFCESFNGDSWITVSEKDLENWQSLFSHREMQSLSALYVRNIKLDDSSFCFIVLADSLLGVQRCSTDIAMAERSLPTLTQALSDNLTVLRALSQIACVNKSEQAIKAHAESAFSAKKTGTFISVSCESLFPDEVRLQTDISSALMYNAIVHQIARLAGSSNIVHADPCGVIRIVLFTSLAPDVSFYILQLKKPLERLFGIDRAKKIAVTDSGNATSIADILDFVAGAK